MKRLLAIVLQRQLAGRGHIMPLAECEAAVGAMLSEASRVSQLLNEQLYPSDQLTLVFEPAE